MVVGSLNHESCKISKRVLCKNQDFFSCTPTRCKILARNGLLSLTKKFTAKFLARGSQDQVLQDHEWNFTRSQIHVIWVIIPSERPYQLPSEAFTTYGSLFTFIKPPRLPDQKAYYLDRLWMHCHDPVLWTSASASLGPSNQHNRMWQPRLTAYLWPHSLKTISNPDILLGIRYFSYTWLWTAEKHWQKKEEKRYKKPHESKGEPDSFGT